MGLPCLFSPFVSVILSVFPSCAQNVENLNNRQNWIPNIDQNLRILLKPGARLFVWAIIFQWSDFKLPDLAKNAKKKNGQF